ncbi:MAG: carboxypeptidase regulatory-like domain-containing protein, partial [Terriglobales bacterium]
MTTGLNRAGCVRTLGLLLLAVALIGFLPLQAQTATSSGNFSGRVTDKTGALLVGAQIKLTNVETGSSRTAPSNGSGLFNFALVTPGTYVLTATKSGFATAHSLPTSVQVGQTITLNFAMVPGSETQTVEVTGAAPLVNTSQTGVAGNISTAEVQSLPINGNDYGSLAVLVPGVKPVRSYDPTKDRVASFSVDGGTGRNVNVTVDGVENKDNSVGGPSIQLPLNAVQEFKVSPSRFSAANGRSEGAAVNVVEKAGSNHFHGGAQYYFTNTSLNANDYFSKQAGQATSLFDRSQYGVDIGGPVQQNKTFFFLAYFRDQEKTAIPVTPDAQAELKLAEPIGAKPVGVIPTPYHDNRWAFRVDHTLNSANHLSFTFDWQSNYGLNDQDGNTTDATDNNFTKNNFILGGLSWNTIINPTTVNTVTAGYQYWNNLIDTKQITPITVSFPDGTSFGTNGNVPQNTTQKKWELRDDLALIRGNHSLKFGEDFIWEPTLNGFFKYNENPNLSFQNSAEEILANYQGLYPEGFATPGAITSMSLTAGDPYYAATGGVHNIALYAEDDWQATQRLTFNLGLRYGIDYNTFGQNDMTKARGTLALQAISNPYGGIPKTDYGDVAPVLGFTYDITGHRTQLLRGGFGMYYGEVFNNQTIFALQQTDPTMFSTVYSENLTGPGGSCLTQPCDVPGTNIPLNQYRLGVDPAPVFSGTAPTALAAGGGADILDPSFRNPVSEQFNLGYTWGISTNSALRVDYVHELGLHEMKDVNIDPLLNVNTGVHLFDSAFAKAGLPALRSVTDYGTFGRSRYDSLDVEYQRRMTHNFSYDVSYTLSRSLAWEGSAASFGGGQVTQNFWDPLNFGYSGTDQRHRIVGSGIFNLPWGINFAPIMQWGSANPYSATMGQTVFGYGPGFRTPYAIVPNDDPTNYTAYASASKKNGEIVYDPSTGFNTMACLGANTCHEIGINPLRGGDFFDLDTRFGKRITLGEHRSLNLFFQAFDLTNRTNFGGFN